MRRVSSVIILAFALLLSSFTLTSASADRDDDKNHGDLRLTAISTDHNADIDVGDEGESLGDYFVFSDDLFMKGRMVGTLEGQCTVTRIDEEARAFHQQCLVTAVLPKGQITVQGAVVFEEDSGEDRFTLAVTGGTGRYSGAGGEVHVRFVSDTKAQIQVDLED